MVKIKWYGHSSFEINGSNVTIGTDLFPGSVIGITASPSFSADIILSSHSHPDHYGRKIVKKCSKDDTTILKWKNGDHGTIKGVKVKGIASNHDDKGGLLRGPNTIYVFEVDQITFCHLGDLGHVLNEEQVKEIGEIDVLLIPIGGGFTVGLKGVQKIIEQLSPKIVIPCHYYFKGMSIMYKILGTIKRFLKIGYENVRELDSSNTEISKDNLPSSMEVLIFKPPE